MSIFEPLGIFVPFLFDCCHASRAKWAWFLFSLSPYSGEIHAVGWLKALHDGEIKGLKGISFK